MRFGSDFRLKTIAGLLVLVALLGYLIGHRHSSPASAASSRSLTDAGVLLEHPAGWGLSHLPPADGALGGDLRQMLVLAPAGRSTEAGLVVGLSSEATRGPLPTTLLARIDGDPRAEVVLMVAGVQAYRYSDLALSESELRMTAYSIPTVAANTVVALCYATATAAGAKAKGECEQIVEALTPLQAEPKELAPYARPAGLLDAALGTLVAQRAAIRLQMHATGASSLLVSLATRMADLFAAAGRKLSSLPLLLPHGSQAGLALIGSLLAVQRAYLGLAAAAANSQSAGYTSAGYTSARGAVYTAEANLQKALNDLALLGY